MIAGLEIPNEGVPSKSDSISIEEWKKIVR